MLWTTVMRLASQQRVHTGCADHEHVARAQDGTRNAQDHLDNADHRTRRRPLQPLHSALYRAGVGGAGGALATLNAMHGRAMRTSCGSMPATVTSATAALASAAALLKPTWVGLVGGAELHRSHRTQPAALRKADTCYSLKAARSNVRCVQLPN